MDQVDAIDTDAAAAAAADAACEWSAELPNSYLKGCAGGEPPCPSYQSVAEAKAACASSSFPECSGVTTRRPSGDGLGDASLRVELRSGFDPISVPASDGESSYVIKNIVRCKTELPPDPVYLARAKAAYGAMARADGPEARWIYQGWALHAGPYPKMAPPSTTALSRLHGFSAAARQISGRDGNFILLDMDTVNAENRGQWRQDGGRKAGAGWKGRWGIPFIWTALHTFGGR